MSESLPSISALLLDEHSRFSLAELCQICRTSAEYVIEMVEEGVIDAHGGAPPQWYFDTLALKRLQTAARLQQDLKVNLAGAALALDLLEEIETLRRRIDPSL